MKWILSTVLGLGMAFSCPLSAFAKRCELKGTQSGTMALVTGNGSRLSSRSDQSPTARLASITLTCTGGMQLIINPPIARPSTPSTGTRGIQVWNGSSLSQGTQLILVTDSQQSILLPGPFTDRIISFDLYADSAPGRLLTPGNYTYDFHLLLTPQ